MQELISVLNQIPQEVFSAGEITSKESYHSLFMNQQVQNSAVSIVDGVNGIAVIIRYCDGKLEMVLTDEMDKVRQDDLTYLEPTQIWLVQDQALLEFMQKVTEHPPVITYSVGAEYEWQDPMEFSSGNFLLSLRLIEGWESERVTNSTNSGIRCRPEDVTEGWIYFSFWPDGYAPVEEDRYISEGIYYDWPYHTSYPSDVKTPRSFSTIGRIWSYQRYDLDEGDYAIINDGADSWFLDYKDEIQDIISLSGFTTE